MNNIGAQLEEAEKRIKGYQASLQQLNEIREELRVVNKHLRELLQDISDFLKHAPEFPYHLLTEAEVLQDKVLKELKE